MEVFFRHVKIFLCLYTHFSKYNLSGSRHNLALRKEHQQTFYM